MINYPPRPSFKLVRFLKFAKEFPRCLIPSSLIKEQLEKLIVKNYFSWIIPLHSQIDFKIFKIDNLIGDIIKLGHCVICNFFAPEQKLFKIQVELLLCKIEVQFVEICQH